MSDETRFVVRAYVGAGPWRWEIRDQEQQRVVGLYAEREVACTNAAELNERGYLEPSNA